MANFVPLWHDDEPALLLFDVRRDGESISASAHAFFKPLPEGAVLDDDGVSYALPFAVSEEACDLILKPVTLWRSAS